MESDRQEDVIRSLNRRQFLILAAVVVTDPKALEKGNPTVVYAELTIDAGPISNYASDGVYTGFSDQGFFVVRKGQKLQALSAFCTHRKCKLTAESDLSFYCKCHRIDIRPEWQGHRRASKAEFAVVFFLCKRKWTFAGEGSGLDEGRFCIWIKSMGKSSIPFGPFWNGDAEDVEPAGFDCHQCNTLAGTSDREHTA